jgi:hypothetical protein
MEMAVPLISTRPLEIISNWSGWKCKSSSEAIISTISKIISTDMEASRIAEYGDQPGNLNQDACHSLSFD